MNHVSFSGAEVNLNERRLKMPYRVLDAFISKGVIIVLLDPDSYLRDREYKQRLQNTGVALRNLAAFDFEGKRLWEAEFPQNTDYYYKVSSKEPLIVYSFSSFECEIDPTSGKIKSKSFFK